MLDAGSLVQGVYFGVLVIDILWVSTMRVWEVALVFWDLL